VRAKTLEGLERLGIRLSPGRNKADTRDAQRISTDDSETAVLVIPTNEELEIARQALAAIRGC
jgi:acetate kinase